MNAIAGPLQIGDGSGTSTVFLLADNQIADSADVTIFFGSILNLLGASDTIGDLTLGSGTSTAASVLTGAGTLTLGGNVTVTLGGSGLVGPVISGNLDLGSATRTFTMVNGTAAADLTISARISGTGVGLTKAGLGTLRFTGSGSNTYSGTTTVSAGTLELGKTAGVNAIAGQVQVGNGTSSGTLRLLANDQIANTPSVTVLSGGTFDLNDFSETIGPLVLTSGTASGAQVTSGTGTLTLTDNLTLNVSGTGAVGATMSGNVDLGSTILAFTIGDGTAAVDLNVSAIVSSAVGGSVLKGGAGTLRPLGQRRESVPAPCLR